MRSGAYAQMMHIYCADAHNAHIRMCAAAHYALCRYAYYKCAYIRILCTYAHVFRRCTKYAYMHIMRILSVDAHNMSGRHILCRGAIMRGNDICAENAHVRR